MDLKVIGSDKMLTVSDSAFGGPVNQTLVHQIVTAYFASRRSGTKAQKNRAAVSGGGAKPWRQKGTGRARAGTSRSPIWRSGGVTFAAQPRNFKQKLNKKMYRAGMRSIMSELANTDRLIVVDQFDLSEPKTRLIAERLADLSLMSVLIVTEESNKNLSLAARNLHYVDVIEARQVNPLSLLQFEKVLLTSAAVQLIEQQLS